MDFSIVHTFVNTVMYTLIEWDEGENQRNLQKHGVDFSFAAELFKYPHLVHLDTRNNYGEDREVSIVRIVSARKASKNEVTLFEQQIKN